MSGDVPGITEAALPARFVRLGVDVGDARVGLARSDLDGIIATPVDTLARSDAERVVAAHAVETGARAIMVGLPRSLDGHEGPAAQKARDFAGTLRTELRKAGSDALVTMIDERLTTVSAHRALHASGRAGRKHRGVVDQVAAVMILQQALDQHRATDRLPGEVLAEDPTGTTGSAPAEHPAEQETSHDR